MRAPNKLLVCLLALLTTSACGPSLPLQMSLKAAPVQVVYGSALPTNLPPLPPRLPDVRPAGTSGPGVIGIPVQLPGAPVGRPKAPLVFGGPPVDVPFSCAASAHGSPQAASATVGTPPTAGFYRYHRVGWTQTASSAEAVNGAPKVPFDQQITRQVANVVTTAIPNQSDPQVQYDLVEYDADATVTTTYLIMPAAQQAAYDPGDATFPTPGGIYIRRVDTVSSGATKTFQPDPPLKVLSLPLAKQAAFTSVSKSTATDPSSGAQESISYLDSGRTNLNVCGEPMQAWRGQLCSPTPVYQPDPVCSFQDGATADPIYFGGTFDLAPDLGGLIAGDSFTFFNSKSSTNNYFVRHVSTTLETLTPTAAKPGGTP